MLPSIVSQMGPEGFASLRKMAMQGAEAEAAKKFEDVPELEGDFEEESKKERS
jgi:nascent polypeptide-associated complex subunit beta